MEVSPNLDDYFKQENANYKDYDTIFSCLGCEMGKGKEMFLRVEKTYPLGVADIALKNSNQYST